MSGTVGCHAQDVLNICMHAQAACQQAVLASDEQASVTRSCNVCDMLQARVCFFWVVEEPVIIN